MLSKNLKHLILRITPPILVGFLRFIGGLIKPSLIYAKNGWDTTLGDVEKGWTAELMIKPKVDYWREFDRNLCQGKPIGMAHHNLEDGQDIGAHNLHMTFAYAVGVAANAGQISILDWGGGIGHYQLLATSMYPNLKIEYHIKEFAEWREAAPRSDSPIIWHTDDECLRRSYNLIFVSGSLQYMPDWQAALHDLARAADKYLLLTRVPIVRSSPSYVAIQHANGGRMLHGVFNYEELISIAEGAGLKLVRELLVGKSPYIRGAPEQCEFWGGLFIKNSNPV